ncbi:MAG: PQQ-binding-like beta-propeller repeat protein, partial [Planctomycetes bacterium]|nr:PQQ-binding-like beta-propeller repeat protein [Planctomycetota bacterium]
LGYEAPTEALDAATGRTLHTYEGTERTEEIILQDGTLFVVTADAPEGEEEAKPSSEDRDIAALRASSGEILWRKGSADPLPMTLAAAEGKVCYLCEEGVVCLDARTGRELWRTPRDVTLTRPGWSVPTLVMQGDVVLCADRQTTRAPNVDESTGKKMAQWLADGGAPGDLTAYSADDGEILWSCRCAETYHAPVDVFVIDGLVWAGQSRARTGPDYTVARDLRTGEVRRRISPDEAFETTMPHHRCHRNRATSRFILGGRTGVEFIDVETGDALRHHWIRGTCQYGVIPASGLLYLPPHSCACYIEAKMTGFLALAPAAVSAEKERPAAEEEAARLERGPAFSSVAGATGSGPDTPRIDDWPTYRRDAARHGVSLAAVPADLVTRWETSLGGRLSAPSVAGGRVFVASVDHHELHAIDAASGKRVWRFTAGGRIDSPPAIAAGLTVFGSADGHVYCLRASDGELAWRFRAAPQDRRIVACGQLESVWPVHGSVLLHEGAVYFAAGRTSYLDGGIRIYRLDLRSGENLAERQIYSRDEETGRQPDEPMMFEMPGALPDVLSTDGDLLYMRHLAFDLRDLSPQEAKTHLYSPAGFLDGSWWHRTYWVLGGHFYSGYIGWYFAGREVPAGRLLVHDDKTIHGFSYLPDLYRGATGRRYQLFGADRGEQPTPPRPDYQRASRDYAPSKPVEFRVNYRWSREVPLLVRAMVRAAGTLFAAGPPESALRSPEAFEGSEGSILCAISAEDGGLLKQRRLEGLPVHDGMAAAASCLFVAMEDGRLLCVGRAEKAEAKESRGP